SLHPEVNFLGIERQLRWVRRIEARLERAPGGNVRLLYADAAFVISRLVRDASVRAHHLYFPDPWWKRRHEKRRVVQGELVHHQPASGSCSTPGRRAEVSRAPGSRRRREAFVRSSAEYPGGRSRRIPASHREPRGRRYCPRFPAARTS